MKINKLFIGLIPFFSNTSFACSQANDYTYMQLSLAIIYNDEPTVYNIMNSFCIPFLKTKEMPDSPLFLTHNFNQFKSLYQYAQKQKNFPLSIETLNQNIASSYNENLLISKMLLPYETQKIKNIRKNDISYAKKIVKNPKYNHPYSYINQNENNKIITFLSNQYKKSYSNTTDFFGNTPLSYAILTNNPIVVKDSILRINGNNDLYKTNYNGLTPLHLLFSSEIKNKNMTSINDIIIKQLDFNKIKLINYGNINYFQYATVLKSNNLDFYKKLLNKFNINSNTNFNITPITKTIVNKIPTNYIFQINSTYEKNRS